MQKITAWCNDPRHLGKALFHAVDALSDIEEIEAAVTRVVEPIGARVDVVVNYDHFTIRPELVDPYSAMVDRLTERFYRRVTRYAASGFLKARLEHRG